MNSLLKKKKNSPKKISVQRMLTTKAGSYIRIKAKENWSNPPAMQSTSQQLRNVLLQVTQTDGSQRLCDNTHYKQQMQLQKNWEMSR